jgi:O-antigen/teichoic acid export membrane protein
VSTIKDLARNVFTVGLSGIAGQVVTFLSLPLLARLYAPREFGIWALFISAGLVIGSVATLRYELAVVLPDRDRPAAALLIAGSVAALTVSGLTMALVPSIARLSIGTDDALQLGGVTWSLPALVLLAAAVQLGLAWCTRRAFFAVYSLGQFALPFATVLFQAFAPAAGVGDANGLILGSIFGYAAAAIVLWVPVLLRDGAILASGMRVRRVGSMARRYFQYPCYMTPYTVVSTLRDRTVYFLIGQFADANRVGYYSMAQRFTNLPNSFVSGAVRPVFFQHAARGNLAAMGSAVFALMAVLLSLTVPSLVVFWFHAEEILRLFLGAQWGGCAPYAVALSVPALAVLLGNWFDRAFDICGRQRLAFAMEAAFSLLTIAALLAAYAVFGDIWHAVLAQAAAMTVYFSTWIFVAFRVAKFGAARALQLLALAVVVTAACYLILWGLERLAPLAVALAIYYLAYAAVLSGAMRRYYGSLFKMLA